MNDRIYQDVDECWYYRVRGNDCMGPVETVTDAERALHRQLKHWGGLPKPIRSVPRAWHPARLFRRRIYAIAHARRAAVAYQNFRRATLTKPKPRTSSEKSKRGYCEE